MQAKIINTQEEMTLSTPCSLFVHMKIVASCFLSPKLWLSLGTKTYFVGWFREWVVMVSFKWDANTNLLCESGVCYPPLSPRPPALFLALMVIWHHLFKLSDPDAEGFTLQVLYNLVCLCLSPVGTLFSYISSLVSLRPKKNHRGHHNVMFMVRVITCGMRLSGYFFSSFATYPRFLPLSVTLRTAEVLWCNAYVSLW